MNRIFLAGEWRLPRGERELEGRVLVLARTAGGLLVHFTRVICRRRARERGLEQAADVGEILLQEIAARALFARRVAEVGIIILGKDDDACFGEAALDLAGGAKAVDALHSEIHEHQVRLDDGVQGEGFVAIPTFHALRFRCFEQGPEHLAKGGVVIDDHDFHALFQHYSAQRV